MSVTKVFEGNPGESQSRYLMVLDLFSSPDVLFVWSIFAAATEDHLRQTSSNSGKNEGR
jgi:hypothetical protein